MEQLAIFQGDFNEYEMHLTKQLCNSPAFVFTAKGWEDCIKQGTVRKEGGYSIDSRLPAIYATCFVNGETKVVGSLTYSTMVNTQEETYIWIDFVYVEPDYRKDRILRNLIKELKTIAKRERAEYIELGTNISNYDMQKAGKKLGFFNESITMRKYIE